MLKQQQDASCHPAQSLVAAAEPNCMHHSCRHQTCLLVEFAGTYFSENMQAAELASLSPEHDEVAVVSVQCNTLAKPLNSRFSRSQVTGPGQSVQLADLTRKLKVDL